MTEHPDVLQNMQDEVDQICGTRRMPAETDIKELRYVRAVMTEVEIDVPLATRACCAHHFQTLRWRPVAPGGVPHLLTQDDTYGGYCLPKGTVVFANTWSIHQDESEYDRPSSFWPERFLRNKFGTRSDEKISATEQRRVTYAFGAGRRVCPGQHLAENSMVRHRHPCPAHQPVSI